MLHLFILGIIQELGDQLNKVKAEKEKALKSLKTLKVNHDVSVSVLLLIIDTYVARYPLIAQSAVQ